VRKVELIWNVFNFSAFHVTPKLGNIFPESCLLIVVGIFIGVIIFTTGAIVEDELPTRTFFFVMLPPIMLDAGYFMPSRLFFGNLGTILMFAVVGTLWNAFTIGISPNSQISNSLSPIEYYSQSNLLRIQFMGVEYCQCFWGGNWNRGTTAFRNFNLSSGSSCSYCRI